MNPRFKMVREMVARGMTKALEEEWSLAHSRMAGDRVREMGMPLFACLVVVIVVAAAATFFINLGRHIVQWSRCLVGEHPAVEGFKDVSGDGWVALAGEVRPGSAERISCCSVCRKEL